MCTYWTFDLTPPFLAEPNGGVTDDGKPLRGINHVGVTVPDIEAATTFLINGLGAHVIYESCSADQPPAGSPELDRALNPAPGTRLIAARMIQVGIGALSKLMHLRRLAG